MGTPKMGRILGGNIKLMVSNKRTNSNQEIWGHHIYSPLTRIMHNPGLTDLPTCFDNPRFHNFLTPIAEDDIMHVDSSADMIGDDFDSLTDLQFDRSWNL